MQALIRVKELRKAFGQIKAVDGISFEIHRGETFGLLGPNGAGKTTTINLLVGFLKPDSGTVELGESQDPTHPDARKQIGAAPQALSLYDSLTGEENLAFWGRLYGLSGSALSERVQWSLGFSGLAERRRHRVSTYSGGMKRRLNLACALLHEPPLLLLDEPTVGVDPQSRNLIFENIELLKNEGRTILYTTHYMEEAQRLCDRVAIMDHGKILAMDTVDRLIEQHGGVSVVEVELEALPAERSKLPGELEGNQLRVETDRPLETVAELAESGLKFLKLKVDRADLETVFLNLTGRRLRD